MTQAHSARLSRGRIGAIKWAESKIGIQDKGKPNSKNDNKGEWQKFIVALGSGQWYYTGFKFKIFAPHGLDYPAPWCQYFVNASYVVGTHGLTFKTSGSTRQVIDSLHQGPRQGQKFKDFKHVQKGDWVYMGFNWNRTSTGRSSAHVELVTKVGKGYVETIGGNSSNPAGQNKPEGVFRHVRDHHFLKSGDYWFVKPPY